jgi:hypothetical protein
MEGDKLVRHEGSEIFLDVTATMARWASKLGVAKRADGRADRVAK